MWRSLCLGAAVLLTCAVGVRAEEPKPSDPAPEPPAKVHDDRVTDKEVRLAIAAIKHRIYALQNESGHWDDPTRPHINDWGVVHWGGKTALATYALLTAGESYQDSRLRAPIDFLRRIDMVGTYARSCRSHVWGALPDRFMRFHRKDTQWLVAGQHPRFGYHNYTELHRDYYDNSTTQYGVLGVWEGAKRGMPVPRTYWHKVEQHFVRSQLPDGAWQYRNQEDWEGGRATMVTAGLAVLHITQEYLHAEEFKQVGVARTHDTQRVINRGLDWLGANYVPGDSVGGGPAHYYMYGIERVGLASGYRYFNGRDWYRSGARWIIDHQGNSVVDLSFSLLFLVRGRVPVFVNKLRIPGYDWNNRPRDVAHLTEWVSDQVEKPTNWQIVGLDSPVEDWLNVPLLYLSGHRELSLSDEQKTKLKRYIDFGGTLVTTADDDAGAFTQSVRNLMSELYPRYKPRRINADDELMNIVFKIDHNALNATVVHNGVRPLAVHIPMGDASWRLHSNDFSDPFVWQLLMNAYYFATEKGRTFARLESPVVRRDARGAGETAPGPRDEARVSAAPDVFVVRGRYDGNWNPEPAAWRVQADAMHNDRRGAVAFGAVDLRRLDDVDVNRVRFVHVTGCDGVRFNPAEVDAIKDYVEKGGVVLFENTGGMGPFTESVVAMLMRAYRDAPTRRLRPLSLASPLLTGVGVPGGRDISEVGYRPFTLLRVGKMDVPRLMGVEIDGEPRILVAPDDLSFGVLGQPRWGVFGYDTDSARDLLANITLWATQRQLRNDTPTRPAPPTHGVGTDATIARDTAPSPRPTRPSHGAPASETPAAPASAVNASDSPESRPPVMRDKPQTTRRIWF